MTYVYLFSSDSFILRGQKIFEKTNWGLRQRERDLSVKRNIFVVICQFFFSSCCGWLCDTRFFSFILIQSLTSSKSACQPLSLDRRRLGLAPSLQIHPSSMKKRSSPNDSKVAAIWSTRSMYHVWSIHVGPFPRKERRLPWWSFKKKKKMPGPFRKRKETNQEKIFL